MSTQPSAAPAPQFSHTPEPWEADYEEGVSIRGVSRFSNGLLAGTFEIASLHGRYRELNPNAARIVACVNAMAGIANPAAFSEVVEALRAAAQCFEEHSLYEPFTKAQRNSYALRARNARAALVKLEAQP